MNTPEWYQQQARVSLARILPRLEQLVVEQHDKAEWAGYVERLNRHFSRLFGLLHRLYGNQYDFFYHVSTILETVTRQWLARSDDLKALDATREADPQWFQSHRMIGAMCYVDLFADDLAGLQERIPYLKELGVNYIHLMPIFKTPIGDNDGGYAVSSYREISPSVGSMEDLEQLATELRYHGISLSLDFIFNHTSDEHDWAKRALAGEEEYQNYYRMFSDRSLPDEYEKTIVPVFPDEHPGCFTYSSRIRKWIWTTFYNFQWDLNYENPAVFNAMADEMLFLANRGVEILRMDAVAYLWKRLGTSSQNQPEAHLVIQAFNALVKIAAPAMVFKSEAIVHPDEVNKYIGDEECQLSYNPQLMALLWDTLATRDSTLLRYALNKRFALPLGCAWVNYVRCHDDIGWVFSDDDARALSIDPRDHRHFLTDFFVGKFEGSFAKGLPFQVNPTTGDARVSGTTASLCGLERALEMSDEYEIEQAVRRILLLYGIIFTIGGIPLIYLGDEVGVLNDHSYEQDPARVGDSRWVHRSKFDWARAEQRRDRKTPYGRIFGGMLKLAQIRQQNLAFTRAETEIIDTDNKHVLGYFRHHDEQSVLVLGNFSELQQEISAKRLRLMGLRKTITDIVAGKTVIATQQLKMEPYQLMILVGVR